MSSVGKIAGSVAGASGRRLGAVLVAVAVVCGTAGGAPTQEEVSGLASLGFMVGAWQGEAFGGQIEERWAPEAGGSMVGLFRLVAGGTTQVIELLSVRAEEGRVTYRFNHFDADLRRWEAAPLEYRLVEETDRRAVFDLIAGNEQVPRRLIYESTTPDTLTVTLVGQEAASDEPGPEVEVLRMRRINGE